MSGDRPSHWGVWLHGVRPVTELVELARHAERSGAGAIFLADEGLDRDIYVTLTAIALATERVALVPAITNPYSRHPVATAAAFASLEEVAPGRVVVGLGVGGSLVLGPLGLAPARPYTTLVESVDVINRLLAGERVDHDGEFAAVGARLPWSSGRLPIAVAGRGPRVERFAAAVADWVVLAGKPLSDVGAISAQVRAAQGRRGAPARIAWNPAVAWRDHDVADLRAHFAYMTVDMPEQWRDRLGVGQDVVDRLREALGAHGPAVAGDLVPDAVIEAFALTGSRASVVRRLAGIVATAVPELVVFDANKYDAACIDEIAELADEVGLQQAQAPIIGRAA